MTIEGVRGGVELTLYARGAGYAAIQQCLELQSEVAPLSSVKRFFGASPLATPARSWYLGAIGEIVVAEKLARLGPTWRVVNAVPVGAGGSDIDHVGIGPITVIPFSLMSGVSEVNYCRRRAAVDVATAREIGRNVKHRLDVDAVCP
jgi:hypothetical protein